MLICSIHNLAWSPSLQQWLPIDPVQVHAIQNVIPITEGTCPTCLATAKACMFMQFPDLYVHDRLIPSSVSS